MQSVGKTIDRGERRFILFGNEMTGQTFYHPYVNLFGGHDPRAVSHESLYIIRNYEDVQASISKMKHESIYAKMFEHHWHVYIATQKRPFVVYYEDLKEDTERVLRDIQQHFNLKRLYKNFITDIGYCGWPE